eukprot:GEMP01021938.1.p1 GENE.GEMP01021938.1~~GEMP01021938.1.p1  ORF type:complete len:311 (+),score=38.68 GEMP01021938.1:48-980(+)
MGSTESTLNEEPPVTAEVDKVRRDYLQKLGIERDPRAPSFRPPPTSRTTQEAPKRLETVKESNQEGADLDFSLNFLDLKSQDDFRINFLKKLSYQKVWVPPTRRSPQHQTVIIFDWDDTLLCTSFLNLRHDAAPPPAVQNQLLNIERVGCQLLELALKLGQTFIITNAMKGWVEYSAIKYVPGLLNTLHKVKIISARGDYEHAFPGNYSEWKIQAFLEVQRQLDSEIITNLVALGDSNIEMDAVHVMGNEFSEALIKTIKFRECPSPEELVKQLELVLQKFEKIILNARNLKIGLERKWVHSPRPRKGSN